ncbi:MAG: hypothetical protein IPL87_03520 [Candidatus Moraniibacteriota bacterium]|nr:MAG: hypothetical protein IPL87_03520 [Candidatus Moranbacteria bacterium]
MVKHSAHEHFGTLTTESAIGSTWFGNSKHGRLSPWSNNPVTDPPSQIVFLRRKDSNEAFSLTPAPLTKDTPEYIVTHDQGLTEYKSVHGTIRHCLRVSIDPQESVQYIDIELDHTESRSIEVECLFFLDAPETDETMSDLDSEEKGNEAERVAIRIDPNAVLLRPRFFSPNEHLKNPESVRRGALMTTSLPLEEFFLGHHHLFSLPGAGVFSPLLSHEAMRIKKGVERNDSITLSIPIVLPPQKTTRCSFSLSAASSEEALVALLPMRKEMLKHRTEKKVSIQKESVSIPPSTHRQRPSLKTPDPALNILFNTWIPYQTDASRLAAKTGFYQPGGAFGFRDQLQDVINLFFVDPERARRHILRAAREQYENGNVRSWWSPDSGFGVMSLASDHPLWLPWATLEYLRLSGSHDILEETVPFLENRPIPTGDPPVSQEEPTKYSASLLEHCLRAIRYVSERGPHGLPLMRNGDWNDGMNRVGHEKKGESVWMGFFLFSVLTRFVPILAQQSDLSLSHEFEAQAKKLKNVLNDAGWDGHWFRRAFYDDGTPLGSETNEECRIDAIAQSWSILSGAGDPEKSSEAMENVKRFLYDPESKILKLLDPPFNDLAKKNPGYIKDYPPGIRENGSQYNHAVFWAAEASGILGDTEMVSALLECANPIRRSDSPDKARLYEVEPYVVAADIYSAEHKGKGGWTWYTASAGLLYRTILETLCGIRIDNNTMTIRPSFPREWTAVEVNVPFGSGQSIFIFEAAAPHTNIVSSATLDGTSIDPAHPFPLFRDGAIHRYKFILR